ncbi:hypothetical protein [Trinickia dinghuensis]|uniref:hypothetical protein n=1 Tax=Trinickia dinghuensis TaxID=2291023 RepID=UPI0015F173A1|nr:hypothetical protein [Trinickia dinghuensis]
MQILLMPAFAPNKLLPYFSHFAIFSMVALSELIVTMTMFNYTSARQSMQLVPH